MKYAYGPGPIPVEVFIGVWWVFRMNRLHSNANILRIHRGPLFNCVNRSLRRSLYAEETKDQRGPWNYNCINWMAGLRKENEFIARNELKGFRRCATKWIQSNQRKRFDHSNEADDTTIDAGGPQQYRTCCLRAVFSWVYLTAAYSN